MPPKAFIVVLLTCDDLLLLFAHGFHGHSETEEEGTIRFAHKSLSQWKGTNDGGGGGGDSFASSVALLRWEEGGGGRRGGAKAAKMDERGN